MCGKIAGVVTFRRALRQGSRVFSRSKCLNSLYKARQHNTRTRATPSRSRRTRSSTRRSSSSFRLPLLAVDDMLASQQRCPASPRLIMTPSMLQADHNSFCALFPHPTRRRTFPVTHNLAGTPRPRLASLFLHPSPPNQRTPCIPPSSVCARGPWGTLVLSAHAPRAH